jgi:excisionase family DNA binding protein
MPTNEPQKPCRKSHRIKSRFVSCADAGALTGLSRQTWWLLVKDGVVEHIRIGERILIPRSEIDRLIAEGRRPRKSEVSHG